MNTTVTVHTGKGMSTGNSISFSAIKTPLRLLIVAAIMALIHDKMKRNTLRFLTYTFSKDNGECHSKFHAREAIKGLSNESLDILKEAIGTASASCEATVEKLEELYGSLTSSYPDIKKLKEGDVYSIELSNGKTIDCLVEENPRGKGIVVILPFAVGLTTMSIKDVDKLAAVNVDNIDRLDVYTEERRKMFCDSTACVKGVLPPNTISETKIFNVSAVTCFPIAASSIGHKSRTLSQFLTEVQSKPEMKKRLKADIMQFACENNAGKFCVVSSEWGYI